MPMTDDEILQRAMAGDMVGRGGHQLRLMADRIRELETKIAESNQAIVGLLHNAQRGFCPGLYEINKAREALGWPPMQ